VFAIVIAKLILPKYNLLRCVNLLNKSVEVL